MSHRENYPDPSIPWVTTAQDLSVRIEHPRFTVRGRVETGVCNWAHLRIELTPARALIELAHLTAYLESFASRSLSLETAACEIADHIKTTIRPAACIVTLTTTGDNGFVFTVRAS